MRKTPGWLVLGQIALGLTALSLAARVLAPPRAHPAAREATPGEDANDVPPVPEFITEVSDRNARRYRLLTKAEQLFAGFYADGRVRLATPEGKRFSGVVVDQKAVIADLGSDDSFEMEIIGNAQPGMRLRMIGGPFDAQTVACEALP